jgi:tRNA(Ile)-lysidine synthase
MLRRAIQKADLPAPAASHLQEILQQLLPAREDAEPLVKWPGAEARRYRDTLYLLPSAVVANFESGQEFGSEGIRIGPGLGELTLVSGDGPGLSEAAIAAGLSVRQRRGGEEIKPVGQAHTRKLKKLLQEEGVVPWLRDQLPLVFSGDHLVAVADLWIADSAAAENGRQIRWLGRPQLY